MRSRRGSYGRKERRAIAQLPEQGRVRHAVLPERQTASSYPEGIARDTLRRSIGMTLSWCCEAPHASRRTKATRLSPIELPSAPRQISDVTGGVSADVRT